MIQEIITYLIIGSAITLAVIKTIKKFGRKKRKHKIDYNKVNITEEHNCSDCSAECMLRDVALPESTTNQDLCKQIKVNSD